MGTLQQVNYAGLDSAKAAFIRAAQSTLEFAPSWGKALSPTLGASANLFRFDPRMFGEGEVLMTLVPEGLGTADDARPQDLSSKELIQFWSNIAVKTLSSLTNDVATSGAQPVLISLYLPSADPEKVFTKEFLQGFLSGFVDGCRKIGCVYISGETPQLTSKMRESALDIAGAVMGIVPKNIRPVTGEKLSPGDTIILVESSGPHENGFTPLRALAQKLPQGYRTKISPEGKEFWEAINAPSHLYAPLIQSILKEEIQVSNIENITGHGWQKLMRSKQPNRYVIHSMPEVSPVFQFVRNHMQISHKAMLEVFNYGSGLALFVPNEKEGERIVQLAEQQDLKAIVAGRVESAKAREVVVEPLGVTLTGEDFILRK